MPGLDRTGPEGKGSQTGRRKGKCNPENNTSDDIQNGRGPGRGFGRKRGGGGGRSRGFGKS